MRLTTTFIVPGINRDLRVTVKELPALQLEAWLNKARALVGPDESDDAIFATAALLLDQGFLPLYAADFDAATHLADQMLATASVVGASGQSVPLSKHTVDGLIKNGFVLFTLRVRILRFQLRFCLKGVRRPFRLPREHAFRSAMTKAAFAVPANVPRITGAVVGQGMATILDMQHNYSFSDALDILEILNVRNYNQWASMEATKHARR